jgi:hypothetical protein
MMKIILLLSSLVIVSGCVFKKVPQQNTAPQNPVLEQIDESQIRLASIYAWYSRLALGLIALSFFLQIIDSVKHTREQMGQETAPVTVVEPVRDTLT